MARTPWLGLLLALPMLAQEPFVPLSLDQAGGNPVLDRNGARSDWVRLTNQRMEMSGKSMRVTMADAGRTAVVLVRGVDRPGRARPILTGKGEHALLFQSMTALGFERVVVRNPDTGKEWGARLEKGKAILDD